VDSPAKFFKEKTMPKYLIEASYTAEGLRGLQKDKASGRKQACAISSDWDQPISPIGTT
jgi:hypothetical protein